MSGLKPAVVGLIGAAVVSLGVTVFFPNGLGVYAFKDAAFYLSVAIFAVMSVFAFKKAHPILLICISAVVGIIAGYCFHIV